MSQSFASSVLVAGIPPLVAPIERVAFLLRWSGFDARVVGDVCRVECSPDLRPSAVESIAHILRRDLHIADAGDAWTVSLGAAR